MNHHEMKQHISSSGDQESAKIPTGISPRTKPCLGLQRYNKQTTAYMKEKGNEMAKTLQRASRTGCHEARAGTPHDPLHKHHVFL